MGYSLTYLWNSYIAVDVVVRLSFYVRKVASFMEDNRKGDCEEKSLYEEVPLERFGCTRRG